MHDFVERWPEIERVLDAVLACPRAERTAALRTRCGDDPTLYREVEALLDVEDDAQTFFGADATTFAAPLLRELGVEPGRDGALRAGEAIGPYRVTREIGRGGMGSVYLAERADGAFEQNVAVKVLRRGLDTDDALRRFRHERQILASLDHPGIGRLLGGGATGDGRPYLAMEYVEGQPITAYCDQRALSVAERLRLFVGVCAAVQHAHRGLVVHRDLKPSNILVTPEGRVKLLDFGIAKFLNPDEAGLLDADDADHTHTGRRMLTPTYAAPEQVRGGPITTAADVYALGVLLYELLSGRHPYRHPGRSRGEIERMICEVDPPKLSTLVARDDTPEAETVAGQRGTTPERLRRLVRGDLDTIVQAAMQKDPQRRYATVERLADDLTRHLADQPIVARPPTARYRLAKFVRRNPYGFGATVTLAAVLLLAGSLLTRQAVQIAEQRDLAEAALAQSEQVAALWAQMFEGLHPDEAAGRTITGRELLDQGAAHVQDDLRHQPALQAAMLDRLSPVYEGLGLYAEAQTLAASAYRIRRAHGDPPLAVATSQHLLGVALTKRGDYATARTHLTQALAVRRARLPPGDPAVVASQMDLGYLLRLAGDSREARRLFQDALDAHDRAGGAAPSAAQRRLRARLLSALAFAHGSLADTDRAIALHREALAALRDLHGTEHRDIAHTLYALGLSYQMRGDYDRAIETLTEALAMKRRVLGERHRRTALALSSLGNAYHEAGDLDRAEALHREALRLRRDIFGERHPMVAFSLMFLSRPLLDQGRAGEAEEHMRHALAIREARFASDHWYIANTRAWLGHALSLQNRFDEAEPLLSEAYQTLRTHPSANQRHVRYAADHLAALYERWGRPDEAAEIRATHPRPAPNP